MIEVSKEKLDRILALYTPNYRYLVQASVGHPNAEGKFKLQPTQYTSEPLHHMTSIEAQLCLNQLLYTAFGEWIPEGRFNVRIPFEQYLELMKENMFIIKSGIRFRKPIQTNNDVHARIGLARVKQRGKLYIAELDFSIENGKSEGQLELALKL